MQTPLLESNQGGPPLHVALRLAVHILSHLAQVDGGLRRRNSCQVVAGRLGVVGLAQGHLGLPPIAAQSFGQPPHGGAAPGI